MTALHVTASDHPSGRDAAPRASHPVGIDIALGDITRADCDVIVSATCPSLLGGGGVDRAVRRSAGAALSKQLDRIRVERFPSGVAIGGCVATSGGLLSAKWVIHAAGPLWSGSPRAIAELSATYVNALRLADELGATTVAFPALSAGGCRFPHATVARVAIAAVRAAECNVSRVRFVLSNRAVFASFVAAFVGNG